MEDTSLTEQINYTLLSRIIIILSNIISTKGLSEEIHIFTWRKRFWRSKAVKFWWLGYEIGSGGSWIIISMVNMS